MVFSRSRRAPVIEPKYFDKPINDRYVKNSIFVAITTYDRPESYSALLESVHKNLGIYRYIIRIYDDGSDGNYIENDWFDELKKVCDISYVRYTRNHGKKGYWEIINQALHDAEMSKSEYFFLLQDDCILEDNFFWESIRQWNGITDESKGSFCTFTPKTVYNRVMWNRAKARDCMFNGERYINTGYVDCIFMCPMETLAKLDFKLNPVDPKTWDLNPNQSSGVGLQLSTRLKRLGMTMYGAWSSLVYVDEQVSKMNPEEREKHPLFSMHREIGEMPKVYCGIASIPERVKELEATIESLYDQVDEIYLYLNNYTHIPEFLEREKIKIFTSQYHGDMGDAGKFFKVDECKGYYFSCDDDLIYPPDYVQSTISKIEQNNRKKIVSYHGVILKPTPINKYYNDRTQLHFKKLQNKDIDVHIGGTGVMAFHTDTLKVKYSDFKIPNMADIWMGLLAQEQKVGMLCPERPFNWVKMSPYTNPTQSIYSKHKLDDSKQTELVNSINWNIYAN